MNETDQVVSGRFKDAQPVRTVPGKVRKRKRMYKKPACRRRTGVPKGSSRFLTLFSLLFTKMKAEKSKKQ